MKQLFLILLLTLNTHWSYGQACGIYRIKYSGLIISDSLDIVSIQLPTIAYLHGLGNAHSKRSYIEAPLVNGKIDLEIRSHLTTPFNNSEALISFYKTKSRGLKIKLTFSKNKVLKKKNAEIAWDDISISVIQDNGFGTLFELGIKDLKI